MEPLTEYQIGKLNSFLMHSFNIRLLEEDNLDLFLEGKSRLVSISRIFAVERIDKETFKIRTISQKGTIENIFPGIKTVTTKDLNLEFQIPQQDAEN